MNYKARWICVICAVIFAITALPNSKFVFADNEHYWKEFYVSIDGSDENDGESEATAFKTIAKAQETVREISDGMDKDIIVHIGEGTYFLDSPLVFLTEDSGKNGHRIIYRGENMPQLSGGVKITGFVPTETEGIYKAPVEGVSMMREMYVNGRKSYVATSNRQVKGIDFYDDPKTAYQCDGMYMSRTEIGKYENPEDIEFNWQINWKNNTCKVEDIIPDPDNDEQVIVLMQQGWWEKMTKSPASDLRARYDRPFLVKNAFELLDKPGEFYYNKKEKTVYYMPRKGEDIQNAEVIAPALDKLIIFDGNDTDDRVENITIEGLKIAHSAFYGPDEAGIETAQQQMTTRTNDVPWYIPPAISIERANDIELSDNYFFGYGSSGIHIIDAAKGTVISGNAFSDIGDASIVVGRHEHGGIGTTYESVQVVPPPDAKTNLITERTKVATSYYEDDFGTLSGTGSWYDEDVILEKTGVWSGDPLAVKKGEKSWIRYDFDRPYNITKIVMGFSSSVPSENKMGYEILLSNNRDFKDGTYIKIAEQDEPAGRMAEYTPNLNGEKYRYMMIRSKEAGTFSVSAVAAITPDRKPYTTCVGVQDTAVTNNYIARSGESICSGGGISCFYTTGLEICDNEIFDIPYSGLMFGWGWRNNAQGSGNNHIARNYIHSTNNTMHDGAAIYMLSEQKGTVVEENYVRNVFIGAGAFYPDEGSSYSIWRNNVSEDVFRNYNIWMSTIRENQFISSYGWHNIHRNDGTDNVLENTGEYLPGQDDPKAYAIKKNAGLKGEARKWLLIVPDAELEVEEPRVILEANSQIWEFFENSTITVAKTILEKGSFGDLPGDYPIQYKYKLTDALQEVRTKSSTDYVESLIKLRKYINEAADNVIRMTLDELIKRCETELENTITSEDKSVENSVTAKEKKEFSDKLSKIRLDAASPLLDEAEFALIKRLEDEYRKFVNTKAGFGVVYLWADGMLGEEKDDKTRTIKIYMPENTDVRLCKTEVTLKGTAKSALFETALDYTGEFKLPVYSPTIKKYEYWTVIPIFTKSDNEWRTVATEKNTKVASYSGRTYLSINKAAYIWGKHFAENEAQKIRFIPKSGSDIASLQFIFAANSSDGFEVHGLYKKDEHFRLEINGDTASIYEHINGEDRLLKTGSIAGIKNNEPNEIKVELQPVADKCAIQIWINGEPQESVLATRKALSGYIGFCNLKTGIEVLE
ncbi:MAG: right-handed parallel beta-helix repeat-containing protein [Clostridia bacterium]|nr:right-handed parallel beta-helix repeat-containing protein [Clostridia bacterium]